jgi:hypothetical protein
LYGSNVKTAAGLSGGSSLRILQILLKKLENDLSLACILHKEGMGAFTAAFDGRGTVGEQVTQRFLADIIINT